MGETRVWTFYDRSGVARTYTRDEVQAWLEPPSVVDLSDAQMEHLTRIWRTLRGGGVHVFKQLPDGSSVEIAPINGGG